MEPLKSRLISALRWSERYTRTDMVYLASGGTWLGIAQIAASVAGFILTIALANLLAPETLGEYRYLMSGVLILTIFALPGMRSALIESTPKGFPGNLLVAFTQMRRWGMIGAFFALLSALYYFGNGNMGLALGFGVIAVALPWLDASAAYLEHLKALKSFKHVAVYTLAVRGIILIAVLGTALLFPQHAWVILAGFLFASIVPNLLFHGKIAATSAVRSGATDPALIPYARHLSVMAALGLLAMQLDKVFVWYFLGAEELALFFIAYAIPQEAVRFLAIVPALAFPKFSTADPSAVRRTLLPKLLLYAAAITILIGAYIALAPFVFALLFPQYLAAVPYSQVLMLASLVAAFLPISSYFTAHKRTRALYFIALFVPAVRISATIVFIMLYGLWGAVYAILLEAAVAIACHLYLFMRDQGRH